MRLVFLLTSVLLPMSSLWGQQVWTIPHRAHEILIDGKLDEWNSVEGLLLAPGEAGLRSGGEFVQGDVNLRIKAIWDEAYLYIGINWSDNTWDIEKVSRKDAVWIDSQHKKRRDRMTFFDNLKFHIRKTDYDYTLWLAPRIDERGPFHWNRLLEGYRGMERATGRPMISARSDEDTATLEMMLIWKQLKLKGKAGETFPLTLLIADSDFPGRPLESKVGQLKWLAWRGSVLLQK